MSMDYKQSYIDLRRRFIDIWHPGSETPDINSLPHKDGTLFLVVVNDKTEFDAEVFFCFWDDGEDEPWGIMHLPGCHYPVRIAVDEVEKWAVLDDVIGRHND